MAKGKVVDVELKEIVPKTMTVHIVGDSDLILNKMNDTTTRQLTDQRKDKAKSTEKPNKWEGIVTSIHWLNGKPSIQPEEYSEETMMDKLSNDAPCLTAFGLFKSFGQAVTRNGIDTYATKFEANVLVSGQGDGLIPIKFAEWHLDEKLMSPQKGSPVLVNLNRFSGWEADVIIKYLENIYSAEQIINIINLAGFGIGIGSGRKSGYGRYHVADIK